MDLSGVEGGTSMAPALQIVLAPVLQAMAAPVVVPTTLHLAIIQEASQAAVGVEN